MKGPQLMLAAVTAGVLAVTVTACGSSSSGSKSGSSAPASGSSSSGQAADQSKSPVLVGFSNLEGGAISLPNTRYGFEAGMAYVNAELGGINGHPMTADECKVDATPEASLKCANEFVQKNAVLSITAVDPGADAQLPVLKSAGIATVGAGPLTPGLDHAVGQAYFLEFSSEAGYAADVVQQKKLGTKNLAVIMVDLPPQHSTYTNIIAPAAAKVGLTSKVYFSPTQADWTSLAATVVATHPDGIALWESTSDALAAVQALRAAGFTGTIDGGYDSGILPQLSGNLLNNLIFTAGYYTPDYANVPQPYAGQLATMQKYLTAGGNKITDQAQAEQGYFEAVMAAELLRQVPGDNLSAATVSANIGKAKGKLLFSGTPYDCSKPAWPGTTSCSSSSLFGKPNSDKKLEVLPDQPLDISSILPSS